MVLVGREGVNAGVMKLHGLRIQENTVEAEMASDAPPAKPYGDYFFMGMARRSDYIEIRESHIDANISALQASK
jgi:hypothetical protein